MPRIQFSSVGDTPFQRLIGHNPAILKQWIALEEAFYSSLSFDAELLEQVRRTLAFENQCDYCMFVAGPPAAQHADFRTSLAVALAALMVQDHGAITDEQFLVLREHFDDRELAGLISFIAFTTASQMLGATLQLRHADRR